MIATEDAVCRPSEKRRQWMIHQAEIACEEYTLFCNGDVSQFTVQIFRFDIDSPICAGKAGGVDAELLPLMSVPGIHSQLQSFLLAKEFPTSEIAMSFVLFFCVLATVWFCCQKLAAAIARPLLTSRRMSVFLVVLSVFPLVYIFAGTLIFIVGKTCCGGSSYSGMIQLVGSATAWFWALPLGITVGWKYLGAYRGY